MNVGMGCLAVLVALVIGVGALLFVAPSSTSFEGTAGPLVIASPAP